jgi:hypothetical protein
MLVTLAEWPGWIRTRQNVAEMALLEVVDGSFIR